MKAFFLIVVFQCLLLAFVGSASLCSLAEVKTKIQFLILPDGQNIPIPIGMTESEFKTLLQQIQPGQALQDAFGMMIFGSRTHFRYSYPPTADSDLDMDVFFINPEKYSEASWKAQLEEELNLSIHISPLWLKHLLFFPVVDPVHPAVRATTEKALMIPLMELASVEGWTRNKLKKEIAQINRITADAIFVFRGEVAESDKVRMNRLGYKNVFVIP